jgi:short-subunit dehydrogenase
MFDVNVIGVISTVKHCLPHLANSRGNVLITGSAIGFGGMPGFSAYAASKMALTALQQSLQIELAPKGIQVSIAYVGITENDAGKTSMAHDGSRTEQTRQQARKGRVATQEEVAKKMLRMLERREASRVFSMLGHLNCWINRLAPGLARTILSRHYHRSQGLANLSPKAAVL